MTIVLQIASLLTSLATVVLVIGIASIVLEATHLFGQLGIHGRAIDRR